MRGCNKRSDIAYLSPRSGTNRFQHFREGPDEVTWIAPANGFHIGDQVYQKGDVLQFRMGEIIPPVVIIAADARD